MRALSVLAAGSNPRFAGHVAIIERGAPITYAALADRVACACVALSRLERRRDQPVAFSATPALETLVALLASIELGIPVLPMHPRLTQREVEHLGNATSALLLDPAELLGHAKRVARPLAPPPTQSALAWVATSGTTETPKAAVLSRRAFVASAEAVASVLAVRALDRWLLCMPLAHVGGLSIVVRMLVARGCVVVEPRFHPEAVLAAIRDHGVTLLSVVPAMLRALLDADDGATLARLRAVVVGGAAAPPTWLAECAERGIPAIATYGLTEACSQVSIERLEALPACSSELRCHSGLPLPGMHVRIAPGRATSAPGGAETGRIEVRGRTLMTGYLGEPPLAAGAWLDTGDLGRLDERGRLVVVGRKDDVIITGGENVHPLEIEMALESCAGVRSAAVFGVPDARWGQLVACAICVVPNAFRADEFEAQLRERLASYKRPRRYRIVDALPLTGSGKLDRRRAAERFSGELRIE